MTVPQTGQDDLGSKQDGLHGNTPSLPIPSFSDGPSIEHIDARASSSERSAEKVDASSPATPHQGRPGDNVASAQFVTYKDEKKHNHILAAEERGNPHKPEWFPLPLRPWFWIPYIAIVTLGAIGLQITLHYSKRNLGWPSSGNVGRTESVLHYVYTLPPVILAAVLVAMWTWTDIEIKKMQPYVDLVHGNSPPHRSLLLDYTRYNNFIVWTRAAANKHYLVTLATLMALLTLSFQPLASALLDVRDTWFAEPGITVNNLAALGLNQDTQFNDLTSFLTASGYAGASVLYDLGYPPFIYGGYTVGPFETPLSVATNGTVVANTTAVKTITDCQAVSVSMSPTSTGWTNTVSSNGCSITWSVDRNGSALFGTGTPTCSPQLPPSFSPVIFWIFTYATQPPQASATICNPKIELWDVTASVDIRTRNLTAIRELRPFTSSSSFSSLAANLTGPPLNGRAYNGIEFDLSNANDFLPRKVDALQLQLSAAVLQAAIKSPEGLIGSFSGDKFVNLTSNVYRTYLSLIARNTYFLEHTEPFTVEVRTFRKRVYMSETAAYLLTAAMLLLAICGTLIHVYHREDRCKLHLKHEPGTIASAVSIGGHTGIGELLDGNHGEDEMDDCLRGRKFRIDPQTMKIVMEGEEGYDAATSPVERRRSIFAALQNIRPWSQRLSTQAPVHEKDG